MITREGKGFHDDGDVMMTRRREERYHGVMARFRFFLLCNYHTRRRFITIEECTYGSYVIYIFCVDFYVWCEYFRQKYAHTSIHISIIISCFFLTLLILMYVPLRVIAVAKKKWRERWRQTSTEAWIDWFTLVYYVVYKNWITVCRLLFDFFLVYWSSTS